MESRPFQVNHKRHNNAYVFIVLFFVSIFGYFLLAAPFGSGPQTIHVASKESIKAISTDLKNKDIVRSEKVFSYMVRLLARGRQVQTGDYFFAQGTPVWKAAWMISRGIHNITPIKITLAEGLTNSQMSDVISHDLPNFDQSKFIKLTFSKEGYLFPDTYFFYPLTTTDEVVETLENNFSHRIASLKNDIAGSDHSLSDIVKMASIVQKEAKDGYDAPIIAGILWKRIKLGMPLQVDAARETYSTKGLPNEPISNPGMVALRASVYPVASQYFFYLHDKNGVVHFASTFAEHKRNISQYLK